MPSKLPFTQGYEVELQLVNSKGEILAGEKLINSWDKMFNKAAELLENIQSKAPENIAAKITSVAVKTKDRHGKQIKYVTIGYRLSGKTIEVDSFGPDPNISQITWILELVTPPCEEMEELGWWLSTLYAIAVQSVPGDVKIHSLGFNGMETAYRSGVTFGDHIHIGVPDQGQRVKVYNMLRAFVPHLIAISVNSPFMNELPAGDIIVKKDPQIQVLPKDCTRSFRLHYNKGQMGPPDKDHYIPYLNNYDQKAFDRVVMREPPDDRYVDMFPFTTYGTIEMRFFDTQFSVARRLAITALIQSLAYYGTRKASNIPNVKAEILVNNREKAIEYGLVGKFFLDETLEASVASFYNQSSLTGKKMAKMFQAVQSLIYQLWETIIELHFEDFLQPLLVSVFGNQNLAPPLAPADFLLYKYKSSGEKYSKVLSELTTLTETHCTSPDKDPIVELFGRVNPQEAFSVVSSGGMPEKEALPAGKRSKTSTQEISEKPPVKPVKFSGTLKLIKKELFPEEILRFEVNLKSSEKPVGEGTVILKIVEYVQGTERAVQTGIKKVFLAKSITISSEDLALQVPYGVFQGSKKCEVIFELKDEKVVPLFKTQEGTLVVWGTPTINLKIVGGLNRKVQPDSEHEIAISVNNQTPKFGGLHKLKLLVLDSLKQPVFSGEKEFKLTSQSTHKFSIVFDRQVINADFVTYRFQLLRADKILAEIESDKIEIQRETEDKVPKSQKPKVQVVVPKPLVAPSLLSSPPTPTTAKSLSAPNIPAQPQVQAQTEKKGKQKSQPPTSKPQPKNKSSSSKGQTVTSQPKAGKSNKGNISKNQPAPQNISQKSKVAPQVVSKPNTPAPPSLQTKQKNNSPQPVQKKSKDKHAPVARPSPQVITQKSTAAVQSTAPPRPTITMRPKESQSTKPLVQMVDISADMNKTSYFLGDSVKMAITVSAPASAGALPNLAYRCYFIANDNKNYLVKNGTLAIKSTKKINVSFRISDPLPLTDAFTVEFLVEKENQLIGDYFTEPMAIENKDISSLIRITQVTNLDNQIYANGSLVPVFTIQTKNLLRPTPISVRLSIEDQAEQVFSSSSTTVQLNGTNTHYVPASIKCEKVPPDIPAVFLRAQVAIQNSNLLFEKKFKLIYARVESDLNFLQLGPKVNEIAVGEELLTFCSINNPSEFEYRGKIDLWFYPQKLFPIKFYSRKLRVHVRDRYDFVERVPVPTAILGNAVQVFADLQVSTKPKKGKFRQVQLGNVVFRVKVPTHLPIEVILRTPNTNMLARVGEIIPVQVEVKEYLALSKMNFNLLETFENVQVKKIGSGNLKKNESIQVFNFHWKVPAKSGSCGLEIKIYENKRLVDPRLIKYKQEVFKIVK